MSQDRIVTTEGDDDLHPDDELLLELLLSVDRAGRVDVDGPIHEEIACLGLLAKAMIEIVLANKKREAQEEAERG
jgi:hypothetical protein